ncbi:MAG: hypothetical protein O2992_02240 [Gemmatimonadetes bacterium]|nr:hypothetical protein [Gemmatimonadota bacterium]
MRSFPLRQALALLPIALIGCYVPEPATLESIRAGEEFRIVLSEEGQARMRELSPTTGREVVGQLQNLTEDSLTISTRLRGPSYAGATALGGSLRQAFTFSRMDVTQITVPRLDRARTTGVVAAAIIVGVAVISGVFDFVGSNDGTDIPPDPTAPFRIGR